ncbi:hypothetical protein [Pleionea sp. CnH1-48]|uniref:hypothetical protein n=1 Tax=Pleionea sp. CnH1-48 TaxID=2954494 RepID=UPI002096C309|nr:hypothetical protein [Pleionea sp. CnH1-48]MCO7227541.1 hypothetical protein [Pleionea sp. CnH1-48]
MKFNEFKFFRAFFFLFSSSFVLSGCVVMHDESQLFKSKGEPANYYRVKVSSAAFMTGAKYSSGFYDEKALDIFLNEFGEHSESNENSEGSIQNNYEDPKRKNVSIKSLASNGVYAYIFSVNAEEITRTIGAFSENQVAADHITAILNKERIKLVDEKRSNVEQKLLKRQAVASELDALMKAIPSSPPPSSLSGYDNILNAIGKALGYKKGFSNWDEARAFFNGLSTEG